METMLYYLFVMFFPEVKGEVCFPMLAKLSIKRVSHLSIPLADVPSICLEIRLMISLFISCLCCSVLYSDPRSVC